MMGGNSAQGMTSTGQFKLSYCSDTNRRGKRGRFLAVNPHYITRSRRELFHKNRRPKSSFCSFSIVPLSAGRAARPLPCHLCPLYEQQQGKQTGATSVSEEAVVFTAVVSVCRNPSVGGQQSHPFKHSDGELTFQDTDTLAATDRQFQRNSFPDPPLHPPTHTNNTSTTL